MCRRAGSSPSQIHLFIVIDLRSPDFREVKSSALLYMSHCELESISWCWIAYSFQSLLSKWPTVARSSLPVVCSAHLRNELLSSSGSAPSAIINMSVLTIEWPRQITTSTMKIAKPLFACLLVSILLPGIHAQCNCVHNGDAGRWRDSDSPAGRLTQLCPQTSVTSPNCYSAEKGTMCTTGDRSQCNCADEAAANWQSWHGDWFLRTIITCGNGAITITITWANSIGYIRTNPPSQLHVNPAVDPPEYGPNDVNFASYHSVSYYIFIYRK